VIRRYLLMILILGTGALAPVPVFAQSTGSEQRIVSLAPSITELLFTLDLGDRVVGVTDWCRWPSGVADLPRVGGVVNPNIEVVAKMKPSLVVIEEANDDVAQGLERLGLNVLRVDHRDTAGILDSITLVGAACHRDEAAATLKADLESRLQTIVTSCSGESRPVALVIVGRDVASGELRDVYAAARGTFLGELLEAAGGQNALTDKTIRYPTLGREALLRMKVDHVFELAPELADDADAIARLQKAWVDVGVPAGSVHVLTADALLIPGPRFVSTVETLSNLLAKEGS
jgi:iron complex transport system substrate-binding protein